MAYTYSTTACLRTYEFKFSASWIRPNENYGQDGAVGGANSCSESEQTRDLHLRFSDAQVISRALMRLSRVPVSSALAGLEYSRVAGRFCPKVSRGRRC